MRTTTGAGFSHRRAFSFYLVLFAFVAWPYLRGGVVAASRQGPWLGLDPRPPLPGRIETPKFADYHLQWLPETKHLLDGARSGWLATWNPFTELGRPAYHEWGLSPAYLPTWILSRVTADAPRLYTAMSLGILLAGGAFAFLLTRELGLGPAASLTAAACLSLTPYFVYWLSMPLAFASASWSCLVLYGLARLRNRPDPRGWALLAFGVYSLLMTGYQQDVVYHLYLIGGFALVLLSRRAPGAGPGGKRPFLLTAGSSLAAGLACSAPSYLDLLERAAASARLAVDPSFFTAAHPPVDSWASFLRLAFLGTFPELLGNPVSPAFPFPYDGVSLPPLVLLLIVSAAAVRIRGLAFWWGAAAAGALFTFCGPLYVFGIRHLGFHLSRAAPQDMMAIPLAVIAAYAIESLVPGRAAAPAPPASRWIAATVPAGAAIAMLGGTAAWAYGRSLAVRPAALLAGLSIIALFALLAWRRSVPFLAAALFLTAAVYARPLVIWQWPADLAWSSPLVELVRSQLGPGERYAVLGDADVLPPNLNSALGLPSVHTYDSLSPRSYHSLVERLGGAVTKRGRHNRSIGPRLDSVDFLLSGVSLVLSPRPLADTALRPVGSAGGLFAYRVVDVPGRILRLRPEAARQRAGDDVEVAAIDRASLLRAPRTLDAGDRLEIELPLETSATVLVVSQSFHPRWEASTLVDGAWSAARTTRVNGFFQGVAVPPRATRVVLRFLPWVRYAWIGHGFFGALGAALLVGALRTRILRRGRPPKLGSTPPRPV